MAPHPAQQRTQTYMAEHRRACVQRVLHSTDGSVLLQCTAGHGDRRGPAVWIRFPIRQYTEKTQSFQTYVGSERAVTDFRMKSFCENAINPNMERWLDFHKANQRTPSRTLPGCLHLLGSWRQAPDA